MNKWEEVAKIFDLELNERFRIEGHLHRYFFRENGLFLEFEDNYDLIEFNENLIDLLNGEKKIIKKPWKPKKGDTYWYWDDLMNRCANSKWCDLGLDLILWKSGNCFKTEEEAEIKGNEIMEQIKREFEND